MANKKRYQVFVSSTYLDLVEERQEVLKAIIELGSFPAGMEFFPADNEESWQYVKTVIDDSDYYVVIVGGRYGSLRNNGLSFTEKEYLYARDRGKPVLAFLHADVDSISVGKSDITPRLRSRLREFRTTLRKNHLCKEWSTAQDLAAKVSRSLSALFVERPAVGWVRQDGTDKRVPMSAAYDVIRHRETLRMSDHGFDNELNMIVKARASGFEVFYRQAAGTGSTRFVSAKSLIPSATVLSPFIDQGDWRKYFVHVGRQLTKDEEIAVHIVESYEEDARDKENEHGYYVNHGLARLELAVDFDNIVDAVEDLRWHKYRGETGFGDVVDGGMLDFHQNSRRAELAVENPEIGHSYIIEWSFPDGSSAPGNVNQMRGVRSIGS